jgi:hypothetical protein
MKCPMCGKKVRELTWVRFLNELLGLNRETKKKIYDMLRRDLGIANLREVMDSLYKMPREEKEEKYKRVREELIEAFESDGEGRE